MIHTIPQKGFSMVEVLLSVALIAMLGAISVPMYLGFMHRNDLEVMTVSVAQSFRRAQALAQAMEGDSNWGLRVQTGSITLFKGTSYASRDTTYDELTDIPASLTASGLSEVVYTKFTGLPSTTGTVTLTSSATNQSRTITLNAQGTVTY